MRNLSQPIILVIDADPLSGAATCAALQTQDYQTYGAENRSLALAAAENLAIDLVVCDIVVGNDSGLELITEIRRLPWREDVPVMFASTNQSPDVIRRTHEFGAAFHLKKPIDTKVLLELVECAMWLPHLVSSHINKPHFEVEREKPATPIPASAYDQPHSHTHFPVLKPNFSTGCANSDSFVR